MDASTNHSGDTPSGTPSGTPSDTPSGTPSAAPRKPSNAIYRAASSLAAIEGLIIIAMALFLIVNAFFSEVSELDALLAEIVFAILAGLGLIVASRGLKSRKNWGRAPVVIANLIALPVSYYLITSKEIFFGVALGALALASLITAWLAIPASAYETD
jgi:hypothetical protein